MQREQLKILLLQFRDDEFTAEEEAVEFARHAGLQRSQFTLINTVEQPDFKTSVMQDFDALFVGGSSYISVVNPEHLKYISSSQRLLQHCYDNNYPVFASCFGIQLAALQFGGGVIYDPDNMEMGVMPIDVAVAAETDIIMHDTPTPFIAVSAHKERVNILPLDAISLCSTAVCPYHGFKMAGKPFYAFQFHPEVGQEIFIERITRYKDRYFDNNDYFEEMLRGVKGHTPHANELVKKFVDRILLAE